MASIRQGIPRLSLDTESGLAASTVARQGAWVLTNSLAYSGLGFAFWALAIRFFPPDQVGFIATLASLAFLATALTMLGFDFGLVRFLAKARHPRRLIARVLLISGALGGLAGFGLSASVLGLMGVATGQLLLFAGVVVVLTVSQNWLLLTDAALIAFGRAHLSAFRALGFGVLKVAALVAVASEGIVGLVAAYTIPLFLFILGTFLFLPRIVPKEDPAGVDESIRGVAALSLGNWVGALFAALPHRLAPSLIFIFVDASAVAFFFIPLQIAWVLNYVADAIALSLIAHGSREDRLDRSLTTTMRGLLLLVLTPLVAIGIVAAPFALLVAGGEAYAAHALALQLFLISVLPRSLYQILKARFNFERRYVALIIAGGSSGLVTLAVFVTGLVLRIPLDVLAISWAAGGTAGLAVAHSLARRRPNPPAASADPG